MIHTKENAVVTRHNKLIEARYHLTVQEKRLVLWLLSEIQPGDTELNIFRIGVSDFAKFVGIDGNKKIYEELAVITERLLNRTSFSIQDVDDRGKKTITHVKWIASVKYFFGYGYVDIEISKQLLPYLFDLKREFTSLQLRHAVALSSFYAIRLYELLKQYESIRTRECTINELREYFGICEGKYKFYKDLRTYTVDIAVREINEKTDILVSYEEKKDGRRVGSLLFTIRRKTAAEDAAAEAPPADGERVQLARRLVALGMSEAETARMLDTYQTEDPERVPWHLDELARLEKAGGGKIRKTPLAWMRWAVKEDLREQRPLASVKASNAIASEKERIKGGMARLTTDEKAAYRQEFEREVAAGKLGKLQKNRFDQTGWNSETTKRAWLKFMAGKLGVACSAL